MRQGINIGEMNSGSLLNSHFDEDQALYAGTRQICRDQSNLASPMDFMAN